MAHSPADRHASDAGRDTENVSYYRIKPDESGVPTATPMSRDEVAARRAEQAFWDGFRCRPALVRGGERYAELVATMDEIAGHLRDDGVDDDLVPVHLRDRPR